MSPEQWMEVRPEGLYCVPADAFVDPHRPVARAIVTHGHADHARSGHGTVFATPETLSIMRTRYAEAAVAGGVALAYHQKVEIADGVTLWLAPAGHILGSAQAVLDYGGSRIVISGDYKRHSDPTCTPFEVVPTDVFVTEATFALPVFTHPPIAHEIDKLLRSVRTLPDRCHLIGVYALGKCQRLMLALREAGYEETLYVHGALVKLTQLYEELGHDFGRWEQVADLAQGERDALRGKIVLCPPSALADRWSRRLPEPLPVMASGWMQIRARVRQRRAELALIVSDHADWNDLIRTAVETGASDVWITHGRVEALEHALKQRGIRAKALNLIGRDEEDAQ